MAEKENKKPVKTKPEKKVKETKKKMEVKKEKPIKVEEKKIEIPKVETARALEIIHLRPLVTEKAVMGMESQNVLGFETTINVNKEQIKKEVEEIFKVKVDSVRTLIRKSKKYAYVKLNPKDLAIDIATKLGMI